MIFKGNTRLTPPLTDLLNDNTPSNDKTYSSAKIQTLLKTDAVTPLFKITKETLQNKLPSTLSWNTSQNYGNITFFTLNINDFIKIGKIPAEDYDKYSYLIMFEDEGLTKTMCASASKTSSQCAIIHQKFGGTVVYIQFYYYGQTEIGIYPQLQGVCGLDVKFIKNEKTVNYYLSWSPFTNLFPTFNFDVDGVKNNMCNATIYAFPRGSI